MSPLDPDYARRVPQQLWNEAPCVSLAGEPGDDPGGVRPGARQVHVGGAAERRAVGGGENLVVGGIRGLPVDLHLVDRAGRRAQA